MVQCNPFHDVTAHDKAIWATGRACEVANTIQQLRKNAGLDLKDKVEA